MKKFEYYIESNRTIQVLNRLKKNKDGDVITTIEVSTNYDITKKTLSDQENNERYLFMFTNRITKKVEGKMIASRNNDDILTIFPDTFKGNEKIKRSFLTGLHYEFLIPIHGVSRI